MSKIKSINCIEKAIKDLHAQKNKSAEEIDYWYDLLDSLKNKEINDVIKRSENERNSS